MKQVERYIIGGHDFIARSYSEVLSKQKPVNLLILTGVPGSGKSTWGRGVAEANNYHVVNADDVRRRIGIKDAGDQSRNGEIYAAMCEEVKDRLRKGENVIADSTGILLDVRKNLRETVPVFQRENIGIHLAFFTNLEQGRRRNKRRRGETYVGVDAWRKFREGLELSKIELSEGESKEYDSILFIEEAQGQLTKGYLVVN
jgi:predicted kinase